MRWEVLWSEPAGLVPLCGYAMCDGTKVRHQEHATAPRCDSAGHATTGTREGINAQRPPGTPWRQHLRAREGALTTYLGNYI